MKTLGLLGGMSWESTVTYYQIINETVNRVIYDELCRGIISPDSRHAYTEIIGKLKANGAQGAILGCTEIGLLIHQEDSPLPVFDTTVIHARKAALLSVRCP